jgi:transcriptional regulator with XRE-family HTH domain
MISEIVRKLRDHEYRTAFVASQINIGIPFQIRALMKARGWTQEQLAERTGMLQPRISAILKPGKVRPNIETLRRIAEAFDCGLLVRFAAFSELARWSDSFDPDRFSVPAFEADPVFKPNRDSELEKAAATTTHAWSLKDLALGLNPDDLNVFNVIRNMQRDAAKPVQRCLILQELTGARSMGLGGESENAPETFASPGGPSAGVVPKVVSIDAKRTIRDPRKRPRDRGVLKRHAG